MVHCQQNKWKTLMPALNDLFAMMVKFDERQKTIFNMLYRVEKHLEKLMER